MTEALPKPAIAAPLPLNEAERLAALRRYDILDTPPEAAFDRITALAARLFQVPTILVSLVDESRAWFKSCYGFDLQEVRREDSICSFALLYDRVLVIPDTQQDRRFGCNPFVQSDPGLRFYAGAPLLTQDGFNLGTLCLLDFKPHPPLTEDQEATLADLAAMVVDELELRLAARKVAQIDTALLEVTHGVAAAVGEAFFPALVQHLSRALGVDYVFVGLMTGANLDAIRTVAVCAHGEIADNFEYSLQDTPCREIIRQRHLCCYAKGIQECFPNAPLLAPLGIESYVAIPFFDSAGTPLGLLGAMHSKPLENLQIAEALLPIFALRIAAELEQQQVEATKQQAGQELERLVEQRTRELSQINQRLSLEIAERQQAESELLISDTALRQMPDAVLLTDLEGRIQRWLGNAERIFGYTAAEVMGKPVSILHHPDFKPSMTEAMVRSLEEIGEFCGEVSCQRKDGTPVAIETTSRIVYNKAGEPIFFVGINKDITERKQIEAERAQLLRQQVQEQTARLEAEAEQRRSAFLAEVSATLTASLDYERTLTNVAHLMVPFFADWCAIDLLEDNYFIHRVAVAHCDPNKVQLAWDLHRQYPRHLDAPEGSSKVMRTRQTEIVSDIPDALLVTVAQDDRHLQLLRELGLKSYVVAPLIARQQVLGAITFVTAESGRRYSQSDLALVEDITHRAAIAIDNARLYREAQQAQQSAERSAERITRLQSVTAALSESLTPAQVSEVIVDQGIAALGADFAAVALLNEAGTELEVVRIVGCELEPLECWQRFSVNAPVPLAEAVRTKHPIWAEPSSVRAARYPQLAKQYEQYNYDAWVALPLLVEGRAIGGISFGFADAPELVEEHRAFILSLAQQCAQAIARTYLYEAERLARSEAEAANRVKDEFLAVLSHELRSPLNPILGWVKLLRGGMLDANQTARALETIERNAKLQTQLIEDLLDVSRILQGKLSLNMAPVDLITTIQSAVETVRLAAEAKSIQIQTMFDSTLESVLGDSARLQQIVWNLLTNAVKFTPPGGHVQIQLNRTPSHAQIQVIDNGKGIHPDFLPHVFEYFRQADSTTTRKFGGLGLGLAIVRHLVELHGGMVQVSSPGEDQGATFTVSLPLLRYSRIRERAQDTPLPAVGFPLAGVRVLLVDDEADSRELIAFILEQSGAIATMVDSAIAALTVFSQKQPDILVSDIGMPEQDGYSLIQRIRAMTPEQGSQIPAIALTAYAGEIDQQQALAAGFQQHMTKPVDPDQLIDAIAQLVARASPEEMRQSS